MIKAGHSFDLCGFATRAIKKKHHSSSEEESSKTDVTVSFLMLLRGPGKLEEKPHKKDLYLGTGAETQRESSEGLGVSLPCKVQRSASGGSPWELSTKWLSRVFHLLIMPGQATPRDPPVSASQAWGTASTNRDTWLCLLAVCLLACLLVLIGILGFELRSSWLRGKHLPTAPPPQCRERHLWKTV